MLYSIFKTEYGWCVIFGDKGRLLEIIPFLRSEAEAFSRAFSRHRTMTGDPRFFNEIRESMRKYFLGEKVDFRFPVDLSRHTYFQRKVWEITESIPYGDVLTYRQVSAMMGNPRASRAVGQALAKNPLPIIIPCHRVVRSNGELGGYSAPGGIDMKARLLKMEGQEFDSKERLLVFH